MVEGQLLRETHPPKHRYEPDSNTQPIGKCVILRKVALVSNSLFGIMPTIIIQTQT